MKTFILFLIIGIAAMSAMIDAQPFWEKIADFEAYSFAFNSSGHIFVGSDSGTAYRSTDNGNTFEHLVIRPPSSGWATDQLEFNGQGVLFAYVAPRDLHRSTDNGQTWSGIHATDFGKDLLIDANNNLYVPQSNANILFSSDNGDNWSELPMPWVHGLTINSQGHLFAGTYNQGIFRSTDNGSTWQNVLLAGNITCWHLEVTPDQKIHALYGSYFVSEDGGNTWTNRQSPGPGLVVQMAIYGNEVFVGHPGNAMYRTSNAGLNWTLIDTSGLNGATLDGLSENQMAIDSQGYLYIYCRVFGNAALTGVYRSTQPVTDVETNRNGAPNDYKLDQNYPNPFNPNTTIQFSIPEGSFVMLEIFNSLGEKITTLVSEELYAGNYKYNWNAINLSSGIYYYKLTAGNFVQTKKLVLTR